MAVSTHYNLQKSTLQKFKNSKYQKGTVEETGINLAASNCDWEVAACMSLNMGTGKYWEFQAVVCALSWFEKKKKQTITLAVKVACSKIFSSLSKCYTNHGDFYALLNLIVV